MSLCSGLAGIAVGLGAMMPDLRESSPSKIAAGFGGTLNLVISALFIMLVVLMTAIPWHLRMADEQGFFRSIGGPIVEFLGTDQGVFARRRRHESLPASSPPSGRCRAGIKAFRRIEF